MRATKPDEKIWAIRKLRRSMGFRSAREMAEMFDEHGVKMTRQTYANKERGISKFGTDEILVLADVFGMELKPAIQFFNGWD